MLSFVIDEEDLRIETSYPFNEVTAVFLLNNPRYNLSDMFSIQWNLSIKDTAGTQLHGCPV